MFLSYNLLSKHCYYKDDCYFPIKYLLFLLKIWETDWDCALWVRLGRWLKILMRTQWTTHGTVVSQWTQGIIMKSECPFPNQFTSSIVISTNYYSSIVHRFRSPKMSIYSQIFKNIRITIRSIVQFYNSFTNFMKFELKPF